jgi:hypothetical protein
LRRKVASENFFRIAVPPDASSLRVSLGGGGARPGILISRNKIPTCQFNLPPSFRTGCSADYGLGLASPSIGLQTPSAGDYYVGLYGFSGYTGITLTTELAVSPTLVLSAAALSFSAVEGGSSPSSQTLNISDAAGGSSFTWTAEAKTDSGGPWLQLSTASGTGTANVQVSLLSG